MNRAISGFHRAGFTLLVVCAGVLMVVLDTTIVTVSLPAIGKDFGTSEASLTWVINGYMLTFGGFLLLSGRMGDVYGKRRVFLAGILIFTISSAACGMASRELILLISRGCQGLGGAIITAVSLSLIVDSHTRTEDRKHALGVYGLVSASGGALGEVLGGVITQGLNWRWIFLVNVPLGLSIFVSSMRVLKPDVETSTAPRLDLPVRRMAVHNFVVANIIAIFWSAASFSWFVIAALYLQRVCGYGSLRIGLAFMPATILMAASSLGLSGKVITWLGVRRMLFFGMLLVAGALMLCAHLPSRAASAAEVLVPMILLGIGGGAASTPLLFTAMSSVEGRDAGLASGIVNTSFIVGGSLGVAALGAIAAHRTGVLLGAGADVLGAFTMGYRAAFRVGAELAAFAAVAAAVLLRSERAVQGRVRGTAVS